MVFGAAPAGQVSDQSFLQDPGTCSAGRLPSAPIRSLVASPLPGVVLGSRLWRSKALAGPSSWQNPLDVTCVPSRPMGGSRVGLRHHHWDRTETAQQAGQRTGWPGRLDLTPQGHDAGDAEGEACLRRSRKGDRPLPGPRATGAVDSARGQPWPSSRWYST